MPFVNSPSYIARTGCTAETMSRELAVATFAPVSGNLYMRTMPVQAPNFNNGIMKVAGTAKAGGSHGWYCILDSAGNVLAVTADQVDAATTWGTINTEQPLPFTVPYQTYYNSLRACFFGFCIVATTMPVVVAGTGFTTSHSEAPIFSAVDGGHTTPPVVGQALNISAAGGSNIYGYTT